MYLVSILGLVAVATAIPAPLPAPTAAAEASPAALPAPEPTAAPQLGGTLNTPFGEFSVGLDGATFRPSAGGYNTVGCALGPLCVLGSAVYSGAAGAFTGISEGLFGPQTTLYNPRGGNNGWGNNNGPPPRPTQGGNNGWNNPGPPPPRPNNGGNNNGWGGSNACLNRNGDICRAGDKECRDRSGRPC